LAVDLAGTMIVEVRAHTAPGGGAVIHAHSLVQKSGGAIETHFRFRGRPPRSR